MRVSPIFSLVLFFSLPVNCQINYQCVIRDEAGTTVANKNVLIKFRIYQDSAYKKIAYQEQQALRTNNFGLINTTFGSDTIDWSQDTWLNIIVDNKDMGCTRINYVPKSYYAHKAGIIDNLPYIVDSIIATKKHLKINGMVECNSLKITGE